MTVISGFEIDDIYYIPNNVRNAIRNNKPVMEKLHVVIVISNPCQYARRYVLAREFIQRIEKEETNVVLYVAELAYKLPGQKPHGFHVTEANNPRHLQILTDKPPLWIKESLVNVAIKKLLPSDWKAAAWIDSDIEFDSDSWALDTLKLLNGSYDIVQLFSHALDMNPKLDPMSIFTSFGYQYSHRREYKMGGIHYWHPGFAYAITRKAYDAIGGLYDVSILGSGDQNMALSFIGKGLKSLNQETTDAYKNSLQEYQDKCLNFGIKLGYTPGIIRHHFHGSKKNRKYSERWKLLVKHQYDPVMHTTRDQYGLVCPSSECPQELLDDIMSYFLERNEDEGFMDAGGMMEKLSLKE